MEPIKVKSYEELKEYSKISGAGTLGAVEVQPGKFKMFVFDGKEWTPQRGKSGINMSYYDMNKQMIKQIADYNLDSDENYSKLEVYFNSNNNSNYFMLLCNDFNYYTLFHRVIKDAEITIEDALIDILKVNPTFNKVKAIDIYKPQEDTDVEALEIWFLDENNEAHVAYMFPYDQGVIECI